MSVREINAPAANTPVYWLVFGLKGILMVRNYNKMELASALQKAIRRSEPDFALFWALALIEENRSEFAFYRMRVIMHEDIGIADIAALQFADSCLNLSQKKCADSCGEISAFGQALADALLALCRARKTRLADEFQIVARNRRNKGIRPQDSEKHFSNARPRTQNGYGLNSVKQALKESLANGGEEEAMFWALELLSSPWETTFYETIDHLVHIMPEGVSRDVVQISLLDTIKWRRLKKDAYYLSLANTILGISRCGTSLNYSAFISNDFAAQRLLRHICNVRSIWRPDIPDHALDMHTRRGRKAGRGMAHFLTGGATRLNNEAQQESYLKYRQEAYGIWLGGGK